MGCTQATPRTGYDRYSSFQYSVHSVSLAVMVFSLLPAVLHLIFKFHTALGLRIAGKNQKTTNAQ
jgi:hypothetical protein